MGSAVSPKIRPVHTLESRGRNVNFFFVLRRRRIRRKILREPIGFPALVKHAAIIAAIFLLTGTPAPGAPVRSDIGPDTEAPADDLVCEQGAEPGAEAADPSRWIGRFGGIGIQIGFNGDAVTEGVRFTFDSHYKTLWYEIAAE